MLREINNMRVSVDGACSTCEGVMVAPDRVARRANSNTQGNETSSFGVYHTDDLHLLECITNIAGEPRPNNQQKGY